MQSLALVGDTLFIAGGFERIGAPTPNAASLDGATGTVTSLLPALDAQIHAAVSDGKGGWFIGGDFSIVGGESHRYIAHVLSNGRVARWDPDLNGPVSAIVLDDRRLYLGGGFTAAGHAKRNHIAAIDVNSGQPEPWNPDADIWVRSLALGDGVIYVGGPFTRIGGETRGALAAIDLANGHATAWDPEAQGSSEGPSISPTNVTSIAVSGNKVFVAGEFTSIGPAPRVHLAAINRATGAVVEQWRADIPLRNRVSTLVVRGRNLYVGGTLGVIGGVARGGAAALDTETGAVSPWDPAEDGDVWTLAIDGDRVYLGGVFFDSDTAPPRFLEAVDINTGKKLPWSPDPTFPVSYLAASSNTVIASGAFAMFGATHRFGLAAIDLTTGRATEWAPRPDNGVTHLATNGRTLYAAGIFRSVSGQERTHLAAFDAATGDLTSWKTPLSDASQVRAMVAADSTVCTLVRRSGAGSVEDSVAAFDPQTGAAQAWPAAWTLPQWPASGCLAMDGTTLYVPVDVGNPDAQVSLLERIDSRDRSAEYWGPILYRQTIDQIAVSDGLLLLAGRTVPAGAGDSYAFLEAIDLKTGALLPWIVRANGRIQAMKARDGTVYVGGSFNRIGNRDAPYLAAFDGRTGTGLGWDPRVNGPVEALAIGGSQVIAGGAFTSLAGLAQAHVGRVEGVRRKSPGLKIITSSPGTSLSEVVAERGRLRFTLAAGAPVSVAVYDVAGRRVASLLEHATMSSGEHALSLGTASLRPGLYLYRVIVPGSSANGKLVVLR